MDLRKAIETAQANGTAEYQKYYAEIRGWARIAAFVLLGLAACIQLYAWISWATPTGGDRSTAEQPTREQVARKESAVQLCPNHELTRIGQENSTTVEVLPGEWSCPVRARLDGVEFDSSTNASAASWVVALDGTPTIRYTPSVRNGTVEWTAERIGSNTNAVYREARYRYEHTGDVPVTIEVWLTEMN